MFFAPSLFIINQQIFTDCLICTGTVIKQLEKKKDIEGKLSN